MENLVNALFFKRNIMLLVAITGSIGCGKTTLAKIVRKLGYAVFDVDAWVRQIYFNKEFLQKLGNLFDGAVKNGVADKKFLRNMVFDDKNKLQKLENLIFPFLNDKIRKTISKNACKNYVAFLDAALLFEKGWDKYCDVVILADVDYEIQKKRVMKRDKISAEDFDKINNIQIKNEKKKKMADIVVDTNKNLNILKKEMIEIVDGLENSLW